MIFLTIFMVTVLLLTFYLIYMICENCRIMIENIKNKRIIYYCASCGDAFSKIDTTICPKCKKDTIYSLTMHSEKSMEELIQATKEQHKEYKNQFTSSTHELSDVVTNEYPIQKLPEQELNDEHAADIVYGEKPTAEPTIQRNAKLKDELTIDLTIIRLQIDAALEQRDFEKVKKLVIKKEQIEKEQIEKEQN